jgi:MFS transporter, putative metabolite:H+ symporter
MRHSLPESPRWHEIRGEYDEADRTARVIEDAARADLGVDELPEPEPIEVAPVQKASLREIFEPPYARRSLMLWIFQFFRTVGYYGFGTLAPLVLKAKGYDIVESLGFTALIYCGYPLGSALSVPLMDRFERKHLIIASALAIGGFGWRSGSPARRG